MRKQPLQAKQGEVAFRKDLAQQHFRKKTVFHHEYSTSEMARVLREKMERCRQDLMGLKNLGITLSPFLEIGSGYGQAALLLADEFQAEGFASDIALDPLKEISRVAKTRKLSRLPRLLVFDAEAIPFPDNSLPFVFCYQTLHHFPHPLSVTREVHRVLSPNGVFFFAEEPVAQSFNLKLWYRPTKLRWWETMLKTMLILPFISRIGKTEVDHHIIEDAFTLKVWDQALEPFEIMETRLEPFPFGPAGSLEKRNPLNRIFLFFLGGGIRGIVRKKGREVRTSFPPLPRRQAGRFACPSCRNRPLLTNTKNGFRCPQCADVYPVKNNIPLLIRKQERTSLYG